MQQPQLVQAIMSLVPSATFPADFTVTTNGIATWNRTDITQPSAAAVQAAYDTLVASQTSSTNALATRRTRLRTAAASAVGKDIQATTTAEKLGVLLLLFERWGVLDETGKVLPPEQWT